MNTPNLPASSGTAALDRALDVSRMLADKVLESGAAGSLRSSGGAPRTGDRVEISAEARALFEAHETTTANGEPTDPEGAEPGGAEPGGTELGGTELSEEERAQVRELQARDAEVRSHENAHAAAGGPFAGSPSFEYQAGPDGRRYAIGGEVPISVRGGSTPAETVRNARQIRAAALAAADPSPQDLRVAARATAMESDARAEMAQASREEARGEKSTAATGPRPAVGEGGSPDARVSGYGSTPEADREVASILDLFG